MPQEWSLQNPLPTNKDLYGVYFLNQDTGFVCGLDGVLLKTSDGGVSWVTVPTPITYTLWMITFPSVNTGIAVGNCGTIIRSTDGGDSWQKLPTLTPMDLLDVFFLNDTLGWISGTYFRTLKTTDGGATWTILTNGGPLESLNRIRFISPDTGFVAGTHGVVTGDWGIIRKTINGGQTWEPIPCPAESRTFWSLEVLNQQDLWVGDHHQIGSTLGPACRLNHTTDGGQTWTGSLIGESMNAHHKDMFWVDTLIGYDVGTYGYIFKNEDSGVNWEESSQGPRSDFWALYLRNVNEGFVAGLDVEWNISAAIYRTVDAGNTWNEMSLDTLVQKRIDDIAMGDTQYGCAVGWFGVMYTSSDGGDTWTFRFQGENTHLLTVDFFGSNNIWTGGMDMKLLRSGDGGITWEDISLSGTQKDIQTIRFTDPLHGFMNVWDGEMYAYTDGSLMKTSDGGTSWELINAIESYDGRLLAMDFVDELTGYISLPDEGLAKTTDGGQTWDFLCNPLGLEINYIRFFTPSKGVVALDEKLVACTSDGGNTWDVVYDSLPSDDTYKACFFADVNNGWLVGLRGVIKRFSGTYTGMEERVDPVHNCFSVFPNPAGDFLEIEYEGEIKECRLFDLQGKCTIPSFFPSSRRISVSDLPEGYYLIEIQTDRGRFNSRFVKIE
ncbi:MAG: T9SS type A sorting domain-containing protein [Bacteroidales bacterium]|nr:T9SS type A sorting domain-containing protein [Bacteroidales bacterium]